MNVEPTPAEQNQCSFVLLFHEVSDSFIDRHERGSHWDLLLQRGQLLHTWAIDENPFENPNRPVDALKIHHHRLEYLDYEGPVSNDRGTVKRFERGDLQWVCFAKDTVVVDIVGQQFSGRISMSLLLGEEWKVTYSPNA